MSTTLLTLVLFAVLSPLAMAAVLAEPSDGAASRLSALLPSKRTAAACLIPSAAGAAFYLLKGGVTEPMDLLRGYILIFFVLCAAFFDLRDRIIPNVLVAAALGVWGAMALPQVFAERGGAIPFLAGAGAGFLLGGGLFLLVYLISRKGLGGGDVKFMAAAGLYLTVHRILPAMLYGTTLAAIACIVLIALKRMNRKDSIPLAPFLCAGIIITLFFL